MIRSLLIILHPKTHFPALSPHFLHIIKQEAPGGLLMKKVAIIGSPSLHVNYQSVRPLSSLILPISKNIRMLLTACFFPAAAMFFLHWRIIRLYTKHPLMIFLTYIRIPFMILLTYIRIPLMILLAYIQIPLMILLTYMQIPLMIFLTWMQIPFTIPLT